MTPALCRLAAQFLRDYAEQLGNNGCNDWDWPEGLTDQEKEALTTDNYRNEFEGRPPPDFMVAHALADLIDPEEITP